jgi:hypothetical protein
MDARLREKQTEFFRQLGPGGEPRLPAKGDPLGVCHHFKILLGKRADA